MYNYYCKNCNNLIGRWYYECNYFNSKNFKSIKFLNCKYCDKFIGIVCLNVCENCFGENQIFGEKILFNWFLINKKIQPIYLYIKNNYFCEICNKNKFRCQFWFFKELTFYK